MSRWSTCRATLAIVLLATAAPSLPGELDVRRIRTRSADDRAAVLFALQGAQRKLAAASCQRVLEDFRDGEGRPLTDNLAALALEPSEYIALLVFVDGGEERALCRKVRAAAVTEPRGRVVYVCGSAFRELDPPHRENVLIHEMLHSLGLGENPPSASEINAAVWRRCGGAR